MKQFLRYVFLMTYSSLPYNLAAVSEVKAI